MGVKFSSKRPLTKEEEAEIQNMIASDPDNPELTEEQIKQAKPFKDAFPDLYESIQRSRGRPRSDDPKEAVTLRLPRSVLERWKRDPEWRAKMAETLEKAV
ncbi:BrnA antitoxin family protein [Aquamicrobium lusatiense]|uniref:BrnA antitoxin family protein n=1 Tax=Aquamicrobium lusatiense TaxID=89772 RepID=UPI0024587FF8|nr:BrnA antitoxin family protein [Aquamicrobium lusatiense]MDH4991013.1 BrnA antitoxin family protein [Aquamicrobium lusatiense]